MSVDNIPGDIFLFVIDTDSYSGNFERQLTGYVTGRHNETHGDIEAEMFMAEIKAEGLEVLGQSISNLVAEVEAEGWQHVCTIYPTPGRVNNGMGSHYDADDEAAIAAGRVAAKEAMREYHRGQMEMCQRRLDTNDFEDERPGAWTKEACERTLASHKLSIERAGEGRMWPAYESVAIFLDSKPSPEQVEFMKARALRWAELPRSKCGYEQPKVNIKGFRLIEQETRKTTTEYRI